MYLEIFLADFAVFRFFLGISRDFAEIPEFRGSEALIKETRQNRDSHIFAGRWIFCFWLASFKINSTIQLRLPGILLHIKNNIYYYYLHTMIMVFNR